MSPIERSAGGGGGSASIIQVSQVSLTSGNLTTSSTTFVDATGVTTTITTGAHRCLVLFSAAGFNNTSGDNIAVDLAIDGTRQGQAYGLTLGQSTGAAAISHNLSFTFLTAALSAAAHTFKIMWRVDGVSTGTLFASTTVTPAILTVIELGL